MQKTTIIVFTLLAVLAIADRASAEPSAQEKALQLITNTANSICDSVTHEQSSSMIELSGEAQAQVNGVIKKVADLGFKISPKYKTEQSKGVLQKDLAAVIRNSNDCKLDVFHTLVDRFPALAPPAKAKSAGEQHAREESSPLAQLVELGWTIKPKSNPIQFEVANAPLPAMEQSAAYFKRLAKPFTIHLQQVTGLQGLHYLAGIAGCTKIEINAGEFTDLSELQSLSQLTSLIIAQLPLEGTGRVDVAPLASLVNLKELSIGSVKTDSIKGFESLVHLTSLGLGGTFISDISPLSNMPLLKKLEIGNTRITDLKPIQKDEYLEELTIGGAQVAGLAELTDLPNLKRITLMEQTPVDLTGIGGLRHLETLLFVGGISPTDLAPLANLDHLRSLSIMGVGFPQGRLMPVPHVEAIGRLKELRSLTLTDLQITDLNFVSTLQNLEDFSIGRAPINSIAGLDGLKRLRKVSMINVDVVDVSPLLDLPALTDVTVGRTPARADVLGVLSSRGVKVNQF